MLSLLFGWTSCGTKSGCRWCQTPWRSCNVIVMLQRMWYTLRRDNKPKQPNFPILKPSELRLCKRRVPEYFVKLKHCWRRENKVNEDKILSYCKRFDTTSYTTLVPLLQHDDVIKWKHFPRYWPFARGIHRPPVNSPHKGQWRGALMFSLISAWINGLVNNSEAGVLRRHSVIMTSV